MKRFFAIFAVIVVIASLAVPAFAYDFGQTTLNDDVLLPDGRVVKLTDLFVELKRPQMFLHVNSNTSAVQMYIVPGGIYRKSQENIYVLEDCEVLTMVYDSQGRWVYNPDNGREYSSNQMIAYSGPLKWSAYDVEYDNGSIWMEGDTNFPRLSLAELILEVGQGEIVKVAIPQMVGAMKILVLCGVGCLALLVVLKLFGKRSLIFRS